jgi:hypothetical protein
MHGWYRAAPMCVDDAGRRGVLAVRCAYATLRPLRQGVLGPPIAGQTPRDAEHIVLRSAEGYRMRFAASPLT